MRFALILSSAALLAGALGCSSTNAADDAKGPGGPHDAAPTQQQIADCKGACDHLKFFDCNDSVDQAACYEDCGQASSSQIELFVACVNADICDPTCSTHIAPPASGPSGSSGDSGGTCSGDGCASSGTGVMDATAACKDACQTLQFFSCISATAFTACTSLCDSAAESSKQTFAGCVESASVADCQGVDCYYQFDPNADQGPTPQQITDCKKSCSDLAFFDCITGSQAAACAQACDTATKQQIEAFLVCTGDPTDCSAAAQCL